MIIGFGFSKISVERKKVPAGEMKVNNNVQIKTLEKAEIAGPKKENTGLKATFEFKTSYEPAIGEILIEGEIVLLEQAKVAEEALKQWKKDKSITKELIREVMDTILSKATVESVVLSREIGLPPPIPVPKVSENPEKQKQPYIG
jgi:hypothetical protein